MRDKLHLDKLSYGNQVSLFAWLYSMGGDGRGLWLLLALCTWVMLKAKPLDFNGVDHYFQFILCSNDEWILAGSAKLRVPSEIKSDKKNVTREMEFTCFPECKVLSGGLAGVWELWWKKARNQFFFFFKAEKTSGWKLEEKRACEGSVNSLK